MGVLPIVNLFGNGIDIHIDYIVDTGHFLWFQIAQRVACPMLWRVFLCVVLKWLHVCVSLLLNARFSSDDDSRSSVVAPLTWVA